MEDAGPRYGMQIVLIDAELEQEVKPQGLFIIES